MRIHRLEVQAFGPFADRVVVDVDGLTSGGLFLVHGPTGSGKTSLLDAVCFALYADVPGVRGRHALRSDHAAPDVAPEVVLEVTVGGRRLRLTRSPAWQRPRKRGAGLTTVQAGVLLEERRPGGWTILSTRHDEVADVVRDTLGMGLAQFAKVVLLPQGEFADFLRATPEDRREVLERLFDVGVYGEVERWLADQRRLLGSRLEDARGELRTVLARVDEVAAESGLFADDADPHLDEVSADALPTRLEALHRALGAATAEAMAVSDAASGAERAAQVALTDGRARSADRERGLRARARADTLASEADGHAARLDELEAADRAATVAGHLLAHDRAVSDLARTVEGLQQRRDALSALGLEVPEATARVAAAVHDLDEVAADLARHAEEARTLARRVDEVEEELAGTRTAARAAATALAEATAERAAHSEDVDRLAALAGRASERALVVDTVRGRLTLLQAAEADAARRTDLAPTLIAARDDVLAAQSGLTALQQRRLDGMAAQLARGLSEGVHCPVCGATEHPRLALDTDPVSEEDLATAESTLAAARAALGAVEAEDAGLAAAVETRRAALGGADRDALSRLLDEAETAHAESVAASRDQLAARRALDDAEAEVGRLSAEHTRLDARGGHLADRLVELGREAEAVHDLLAAGMERHGTCPCGSQDGAAHARCAEALDALARAEVECTAARDRLAVASADLEAALGAAGFASPEDARAARRHSAETDRLREAVATHVRDEDACRAVLAEVAVAAALDGDPPDLPALEEAARTARREVLAASSAFDALERASRTLDRLRPAIDTACTEITDLADRFAQVRELADAAAGTGGDNTLRMRLTSFVLAARLEKVADLANERLRVMGAGRYLLEHSDDRAARGARSGLGLRVLDQWTGRTRETSTLSGGESFMASLALALGLADAVREESGGLDLGTLFVDEGFGSLDEDSLEQVLTVLDGLRDGGRAVGVVSHVPDLRARIPHQAVVHKGPAGSTVEVRTGAERSPAA